MENSQGVGLTRGSQVANDFGDQARAFFLTQGITLEKRIVVDIGIESKKKPHRFDLGSTDPKILVECKSDTWNESSQCWPGARMNAWTESMYYFHAAPKDCRKIFFVLKDISTKYCMTLATYYLGAYEHLIPSDVEFWEFDPGEGTARRIR